MGGRKQLGETASKKQKKSDIELPTADTLRSAPDGLPERLKHQHKFVTCGADVNVHTDTRTSAHAYSALDIDNSWSYDQFARGFSIKVNEMKDADMEFDVNGLDPAIMNAIRRVLISEVPTVAIEHVYFLNNTSVIGDEMLAHRLGLVPLDLNPHKLDFRPDGGAATEHNTVVFKLEVDCRRQDGIIQNERVLSQALQHLPEGSEIEDETGCKFSRNQNDVLGLKTGVQSVIPDILLAKLRPGQCIHLEAHCVKGIGAEHAKWSPVATAWYRLQPEVVLLKEIAGTQAEELIELCRPKDTDSHPPLFQIQGSIGSALKVVATRGNEHHLEKVRQLTGEAEWANKLEVRKHKDQFIMTIQSTGALPPEELFLDAIDVLAGKCDKMLDTLL